MPNLINWEACCGCGACANKCIKQAIVMQPNHEGFLHPAVDAEKCIECGACEKVCPGLAPALKTTTEAVAFVVQHRDENIRYQSTSGGGFTAIAEEIIRRGGVVFGAVMTDCLTVEHDYVTDMVGIARFRNSKYVQSAIGDCYQKAKLFLKEGKWVCFSGTPCQINGLYKYLGCDYNNLIAVDVVCKSVPSPLIFKKYVEYKKQKEGNITDFVFRDKKRGFLYCTMAHYLSHEDRKAAKDVYRRGSESDEWLRLFLSGRISRHSCTTCPYQTKKRVADFTLGDIWETGIVGFDDNKGSTLVHVWSQKGLSLLEDIAERIKIVAYPFEKSRGANRVNSIKTFPDRKQLFENVFSLPVEKFFARYAPYSMKIRFKQTGRYLLWKIGLQNIVRRIKHMIIHRNH